MKSSGVVLWSALLLLTGLPLPLPAVSYTGPGVMIDYQPLNYSLFHTPPDIFISDPEIIVLANGDYIASHALAGWDSGSDTSGQTTVYRSTNKGTNWTSLGTFSGILRGSLFVLDGSLYLLGANDDTDGKPAVLMRSTNNGTAWPDITQFDLGGPATPNNPLVWSNRLWCATGTSDLSAPVNSNLLVAASWRNTSGFPASNTNWLTGTAFVGEGQIVASPDLGVFILPKITDNPYTAVSRVSLAGSVTFDATNNFAALPGAEKKFGAAYDAGSGQFFVLSNPVLPADANSGIAYNMIRNTAAVLTSRDLLNWKVERIFIYSPDASHDGFGYLNFDFDGSDMVVAARTAFKIQTGDDPTRGHDSNVLTFHRLNDFRNLAPDQYLKISGNQVLRYERTDYQDAPLGSFTLGNSFAGAPLNAPNGIGTTAAGEVYVRETGGRILHFDALGNFVETTNASPVAFNASQINAKQPPAGECSWARSNSGDWSDLLNWYYWGRPDTTKEIAVFGSAVTNAATVNVPPATQTWSFNTDGNKEAWVVANASNTVASAGLLQGTANDTSSTVQIYRTDRFFYGSTVPEVRIRLRADANCTVYFYWGTALADAFASARRIAQSYTNNGAFQDFVFPMAGNAGWDGQVITRLRFDPLVHTNPTRGFAVDSISVPKESYRVKGLRFRNSASYTVSGGGTLRVEPDTGTGLIDVQMGSHGIALPISLATNTDFSLADGTTLALSGALSGAVGTTKLGAGRLTLSGTNTYTGNTTISNGTLALTAPAGATSLISNSPVITVAGGATLDVAGIVSGFRLLSGQTLTGNGSVTGTVTVASGATVAPGRSIGTLTFSNSPALQGTLRMEVNQTNSPLTSDQLVVVAKPMTNGGTLTVTNIGPALTGGEVFTLFNAASYHGSFSATNLPPLPTTNLNWWLGNLTVNGSLVVNRAPTVMNASYLRVKGTTLKISITNLLAGFAADADGNSLALQGVGASGQGATITNDAACISYGPSTSATSNANDSFTYTVTDGRGGVRTANITISVVNPAGFTSITSSSDSSVELGFTGVLGYDYVLQRSSNLVRWAGVATNALPLGGNNTGAIWFTDTPPHNPAFYRTILP